MAIPSSTRGAGSATEADTAMWWRGMAAWLAVTAPGLLVTRLLLLVAAVALCSSVAAGPVLITAGLGLAGLYVAATFYIVRVQGRRSLGTSALLLAAEVSLAGLLFGSGPELRAAASAVGLVALASAAVAGGWLAGLVVACLVGAVAGVTAATGMVAISRPPAAAWPTVVSVDTSYADAPVARGLRFAPLLSVETSFPPAGGDRATATAAAAPVLSVDRSFAGVPLPAALPFGREQQRRLLALAAAAQYVGFAVCIRHARKTKRAVATRIAASRLGV